MREILRKERKAVVVFDNYLLGERKNISREVVNRPLYEMGNARSLKITFSLVYAIWFMSVSFHLLTGNYDQEGNCEDCWLETSRSRDDYKRPLRCSGIPYRKLHPFSLTFHPKRDMFRKFSSCKSPQSSYSGIFALH